MNKTIRNLLVILAISPFLIQCASQDEVQQLSYQLRVVNKKIEDMKKDTVGQMQKRQAASSSQIDQLLREINILKGQLDETAHLNRTLKEQNKELETSIHLLSKKSELEKEEVLQQFAKRGQEKDKQLAELTRKLDHQQQSVKAIQAARVKDAENKAQAAARAAEVARKKARAAGKSISHDTNKRIPLIRATKTKVKKSSPRSSTSSLASKPRTSQKKKSTQKTRKPATSSQGLFAQAQKQYKQGKFQSSLKNFELFVEKNPKGEQGIIARYMMGECLFKQKEYNHAIIQYQQIISNHPRHSKAPSALLRQGMAFENLADYETAKIIYQKISKSYGLSSEAATAKKRAASL